MSIVTLNLKVEFRNNTNKKIINYGLWAWQLPFVHTEAVSYPVITHLFFPIGFEKVRRDVML